MTMMEEPTRQPTLPELDLPEYHGQKPVKMKSAISGAGNRILREHEIGDRVIAVVELRCKKAGFEDSDDGLIYAEAYKMLDMYELSTGFGTRLLQQVRSLWRTGMDAASGAEQLPTMSDSYYTDESGVVLTPAEVAERRGDGRPVLEVSRPATVIMVFDSGDRSVWPDDFPAGSLFPVVGEQWGDGKVVELLDHATGEPLSASAPVVVEVDAFDDGVPAFDDIPDVEADGGEIDDMPAAEHFVFMDRSLSDIRPALRDVTEVDYLRRLLKAEQQGRGRGVVARSGAVEAVESRIFEVEQAAIIAAGVPDADAAGW